VFRAPRPFAVSMAGLRQGRCSPHPQGRNGRGGRRERAFLSREECAKAQGKKVCDPPLRLGQRGAAVPCLPKPSTRPCGREGSLHGQGRVSSWQTLAPSPRQAGTNAEVITHWFRPARCCFPGMTAPTTTHPACHAQISGLHGADAQLKAAPISCATPWVPPRRSSLCQPVW
jgi:hypothetical protein